jgi:hypothetical protein
VVILYRDNSNCQMSCGRWNQGQSSGDWSVGMIVVFARATRITAAAGEYRLCWCAGGYTCSESTHFRTDFGRLDIIGPWGETRTCVTSLPCRIPRLAGRGLSVADRVAVLDTCGSATLPEGWPAAGMAVWRASDAVYTWPEGVSAVGGVYRMCWCAAGYRCSIREDFVVDIGEMHLVGTPVNLDRTCVAGQRCALTSLVGLQDTSFRVLDTCGTASDVFGDASKVGGDHRTVWPLVSAAPGTYRLCWRRSPSNLDSEYVHDAGHLTVLGVDAASHTCIAGAECHPQVWGVGVGAGDQLAVLDTCGIRYSLAGALDAAVAPIADNGEQYGAVVRVGRSTLASTNSVGVPPATPVPRRSPSLPREATS